MKIATLIARILLGLVFFVAGLFSILKPGKMGRMPPDATTFLTLMVAHNYTVFVALLMYGARAKDTILTLRAAIGTPPDLATQDPAGTTCVGT
jgi:uncharacterized membrane protein YphA (DoxX/SURF4 family)